LTRTLVLLAAALGCTSTETYESDLVVPADLKITLGAVHFVYRDWSTDMAEIVDRARAHEQAWTAVIRGAFEKEAAAQGLAGPGATLEIAVTDLRPGRHSFGWWVGSGDERAFVEARITIPDHGSFVIETGQMRGRFESLLKTVGRYCLVAARPIGGAGVSRCRIRSGASLARS
jgi:hypothetical protein